MNGYNKLAKYYENQRLRNFRAEMRNKFGPRGYKITSTGEVYGYGIMPNTNCVGWFLFGHYPACAFEIVG